MGWFSDVKEWIKSLGSGAKYYWDTIWRSFENYGSFTPANPSTDWLPDGRNMVLTKPFNFDGPLSDHWPVPASNIPPTAKDIYDGASIPPVVQRVLGITPFGGKYRNASIVHDYYCNFHYRSWVDVHTMFYHGCMAGGVDWKLASALFAGVYAKGPRWEFLLPDGEKTSDWDVYISKYDDLTGLEFQIETTEKDSNLINKHLSNINDITPNISDEEVEAILGKVKKDTPSVAEIESIISEKRY